MTKQDLLSVTKCIRHNCVKYKSILISALVFVSTLAVGNIPVVDFYLTSLFAFLRIGSITLYPSDVLSIVTGIGAYLYQKYQHNKTVFEAVAPVIVITQDDIIEAIAEGKIDVIVQPTYRISTDAIVGFESLVRLHHKKYGVIAPSDFLSIVETSDTEVSRQLTSHVIHKTAEYYRLFKLAGYEYQMSINLLAADLSDATVLSTITKALMNNDMPLDRLTVEISEQSLSKDMTTALKVLASLDSIDVKVSLDNYGTHIVSFMRFKDFLIDEVKIDSSLTHHIDFNQYKSEYIRAISHAAHGMGAFVTAKHIETQATFDKVKQAGCDCVQGYFIAPPMTISDALVWVDARQEIKNG